MWPQVIAVICLLWYCGMLIVGAIGYSQLKRYYSRSPSCSVSSNFSDYRKAPQVTVIRPVKGLEPYLYECLASTFRQDYPPSRLTIYFCISSHDDAAFSLLERVIADFPQFNAQIFVEKEDPILRDEENALGPNPKIRNMSRAYREAKGDLIWIIDCNVWVGKGVCGRMVDTLCGFNRSGNAMPYKFVHHLPLVIDVDNDVTNTDATDILQNGHPGDVKHDRSSPGALQNQWQALKYGGRLEELFMSSSHAKFYTAINTVLVAPCILGKSNMFRKSHLDHLTSRASKGDQEIRQGIDFFSCNICEDHLIGDLLWKNKVAEEQPPSNRKFGKHSLVFGDAAIQPMANMSVRSYVARRVRWLRVRKFTVTLATLVEPGTESFLCSSYGAFAFSTLSWFHDHLSIPQTWVTFLVFWISSVSIWCAVDWTQYILLHSASFIEVDDKTPAFARPPPRDKMTRRPFSKWLLAWLCREALAFPIWFWAVWGGVSVEWRGRRFWVGTDMRVHEIGRSKDAGIINGKKHE